MKAFLAGLLMSLAIVSPALAAQPSEESETVLRVDVVSKAWKKATRDLGQVIELDYRKRKKANPALQVLDGQSVSNGGRRVPVQHFYGRQADGDYQAVAYLDEPRTVVQFVMASRSEAAFRRAMPEFERLVAEYETVPNEVLAKGR